MLQRPRHHRQPACQVGTCGCRVGLQPSAIIQPRMKRTSCVIHQHPGVRVLSEQTATNIGRCRIVSAGEMGAGWCDSPRRAGATTSRASAVSNGEGDSAYRSVESPTSRQDARNICMVFPPRCIGLQPQLQLYSCCTRVTRRSTARTRVEDTQEAKKDCEHGPIQVPHPGRQGMRQVCVAIGFVL